MLHASLRRQLVVLIALAWSQAAAASQVTVGLTSSNNPQPSQMTMGLAGTQVSVPVGPFMGAALKRDQCVAAAVGAGLSASPLPGERMVVEGLPPGAVVRLDQGASAELADRLVAPRPYGGNIEFVGSFQPLTSNMQPAVFTAGIVTDVGELTAQVSAQQLNFQTDGPIICQALFQRLAPHAPQYGAQINYAGDRLEVYFDPAYTVTQGGIIFGTNSVQGQCAGEIELDGGRRNAVLSFSDAICTLPEASQLLLDGGLLPAELFGVVVNPGSPAPTVAQSFLNALRGAGHIAWPTLNPESILVPIHPDDFRRVTLGIGGTAQAVDKVVAPGATRATCGFPGHFLPIDPIGLPAVFTAGIVTDVGELTAQVSPQELNFQTDGPIICQALFQRLAPRAPQYGAQINYAGDRLEVYFDPAYTVTQGGIIFGTTSPTLGCSGTLHNDPPPPPCGDSDFDNDGDAGTDLDIESFFGCLGGACCPTCDSPDFDGDGDTGTDLDIESFFRVLGGGLC